MKSEKEIQEKLDFYEAILAGIEAGKVMDDPRVFLGLSQYFPTEMVGILQAFVGMDAGVDNLPSEDQQWIRQWFSSITGFAWQVLNSRISILRWVLENGKSEGGVTGGQGN